MTKRRGSHRRIEVRCELRISENCKQVWLIQERLANETMANNGGKIICVYCSRRSKSVGRGNPNAKYALDDQLFATIDTEAKAYLLGWIASDGTIREGSIAIFIHRKDEETLKALRDIACPELPIQKKGELRGFTINSRQIVADVCRWLDIPPGKKSSTVGFPSVAPELAWVVLRGMFDGDGSVSSVDAALKRRAWPAPRCNITSSSNRLLDAIHEMSPTAYHGETQLEWSGVAALDFLGALYRDATLYLPRKRDLFLDWCNWAPGMSGPGNQGVLPLFRWLRVLPEAVPPSKRSVSDSGFDLTLVALSHTHGAVEFYRTGVRVQPAFGWYFDLVPRSSISKSGYMLANSIGVIDRGYTGEVLVALIKVDPSAPSLTLPNRLVQMIPRPIIAADLVEVTSLDETDRGDGGFGSTGR